MTTPYSVLRYGLCSGETAQAVIAQSESTWPIYRSLATYPCTSLLMHYRYRSISPNLLFVCPSKFTYSRSFPDCRDSAYRFDMLRALFGRFNSRVAIIGIALSLHRLCDEGCRFIRFCVIVCRSHACRGVVRWHAAHIYIYVCVSVWLLVCIGG